MSHYCERKTRHDWAFGCRSQDFLTPPLNASASPSQIWDAYSFFLLFKCLAQRTTKWLGTPGEHEQQEEKKTLSPRDTVVQTSSPAGSAAEEHLSREATEENWEINGSCEKQSASLPGPRVFVRQQEHQHGPNGGEQWPIYSDILSPAGGYARFFWGRAKHH